MVTLNILIIFSFKSFNQILLLRAELDLRLTTTIFQILSILFSYFTFESWRQKGFSFQVHRAQQNKRYHSQSLYISAARFVAIRTTFQTIWRKLFSFVDFEIWGVMKKAVKWTSTR